MIRDYLILDELYNLELILDALIIEMVKGQSSGQAQQLGTVWQGYLWKTLQGGSKLQTHHASSVVREVKDQSLAGTESAGGNGIQRADQASAEAPRTEDLHSCS